MSHPLLNPRHIFKIFIREMVATAMTTATPLNSSSFLPATPRFSGTVSRGLNCRQTSEKQCTGKSLPWIITAKVELKPPPYAVTALEPHMSRETLEYHWGKHHKGYVENLNKQIEETDLEKMTLEDIILTTYNRGNILPAFNNAAQIWNHEFFWESMKPGGGGKPSGNLIELINRDFGSFEAFIHEFKSAASSQFGSGWTWLVYKANRLDVGNAINPCPAEEDKKLVVVKSPNAVNPLVWDYSPLLTIDVWEHAYYLDFQNRRVDYISNFLDNLVSWERVSSRLEIAKSQVAERERKEEGSEEVSQNVAATEATEVVPESDAEDSEAE